MLHHHSAEHDCRACFSCITQLQIPHRNMHHAETAESLWHDKRRGGRKPWNINHRRGLYSSCHDNSDGWKILSFPSPEAYWHSVPLYLDIKRRDHRHGCSSTSLSTLAPCLVLANVNWSPWETLSVCSQPWRKCKGDEFVSLMNSAGLLAHLLTAWCTFDLRNPSLDSRRMT